MGPSGQPIPSLQFLRNIAANCVYRWAVCGYGCCRHPSPFRIHPRIHDSITPHHPNCRSAIAPVVSSEFDFLDAGAKRAARGADGGMQIDANTSYYDFLRTQPAWFQDQALGPVRGAIFRNAGMTPEEFRVASVDGFGRPLTLKEMAGTDKRVRDYLKGE